jgi:hypothetical protein
MRYVALIGALFLGTILVPIAAAQPPEESYVQRALTR